MPLAHHVPVYTNDPQSKRDKFEKKIKKAVTYADKNPVLAVATAIAVPQLVGYAALAIKIRP